jgi:hypothetical protein
MDVISLRNSHGFFLLCFLILLPFQYQSYTITRRKTRVEPLLLLLPLITMSGLLCCLCNVWGYTLQPAAGLGWCILGDTLGLLSEALLSAVWFLLSQGWTVLGGIVIPQYVYLLLGLYGGVTVFIGIRAQLYRYVTTITYDMIAYVGLRIMGGLWCTYGFFRIHSGYKNTAMAGSNPDTLPALQRAQLTALLWFLIVPIALLTLAPEQRIWLTQIAFTTDIFALIILTWLFWHTRLIQYRLVVVGNIVVTI